MKRELIINGKELKELVSNALETKYENISFEFNNEEDFAEDLEYVFYCKDLLELKEVEK